MNGKDKNTSDWVLGTAAVCALVLLVPVFTGTSMDADLMLLCLLAAVFSMGAAFLMRKGLGDAAKKGVDYAAKQLKPHVSYTLYLASGKCRSLMIPRERAPLDYLETWYRFNPGEVVVKMRNNETGEEMEV